MESKVITVIIIFVVQACGAILPSKDVFQPLQARSLKYHPNMTSMWMVDEYGRLTEVYLTGQPHQIHRPLGSLEDNIYYFLYTREYNSAYQITKNDMVRLNSSTFDPKRPTKVVIHGFWNSYQSDAVQVIREAYLSSHDVNIVGVDWSALAAGPWYVEAVHHTEPVGKQVAQLIDFLVSAGAKVADFHLIGHSLGAHVAGFASNHVTTGRIVRISGLDPALPLFSNRPIDQRLDPSDANLVDCIHTCGGYLGFYKPLCSHDFYPNGGTASQPGCSWDFTGACSHGRSFRYYSVSTVANFSAKSCSSMDEVQHARCSGGVTGSMGDPAYSSPPGLFYLETSGYFPFIKT